MKPDESQARRSIPVRCWSKAAACLVPPEQVVLGRVHSGYARIINVQTTGGRLVTLQGESSLQAPLALALATDMARLGPHLPVGRLVVQDVPAAAAYPEAIALHCTEALVWDGQLQACAAWTPPRLSSIATALTAWLTRQAPTCGLVPILSALQHGPADLSLTCAAMYRALRPLYVTPQVFSSAILLGLAHCFVGLGEGLTPAGDDCLVGLLAVLQVTGWLSSAAASGVREALLRCVDLGTSQLSGEFVRCAWEGHFSAPVVELIQALSLPDLQAWPVCAARLAAVGHSSGVDALVGMVLGCQFLTAPLH